MMACREGNVNIVELLINSDAIVNIQDKVRYYEEADSLGV